MRGVHASYAESAFVATQHTLYIGCNVTGCEARAGRSPATSFESGDLTMNMISTMKDFLDGLSRGLGLFVFERSGHAHRSVAPGLYRNEK